MRISRIKKSGINFLWITGIWIIIAFLISVVTLLSFGGQEAIHTWLDFFIFELACIVVWPIATPAIIGLFRRYDFKKPKLIQSFFLHFGAVLIVFSLHSLVQSMSVFWFFQEPFSIAYIKRDFISFLDMRIVFYAGIILVVYTLDFYKKEREDSIKEPSLRAELNRLKFVELKSRVPPQFLLNTLDAVEYNLEENPDLAEEMVADLSDLLRIMLDLANIEEVSVREDIRHLELYLNLLNKRSSSLINLETNIDPKCYEAFVPTIFYIVPFIEAIYEYSLTDGHSLKKFIYGVQCRDDQLKLSVGISDIIISEFQLNEIKRKAGYQELMYPSDYRFYSILNKNELQLLLDIPFKEVGTTGPRLTP